MKKYLFFKKLLLSVIITLISIATTLAVEVTVNFTTSTGDPIEGSQVDFRESGGTFSLLGFTDANGQIIAEVGSVNGHGTFKFYYDNVTKQVSQNVNVDPVVNFSTVLVTFKVVDLDDNELVGTNARYKTFGVWKTFGSGTTTTTQEMLPFTYAFRVNYNGNVKDKTVTINSNNNEVIFVIQLITVILLDSEGNGLESDDIQILDDGNWVQFGDGVTPESVEMLPTSAKFRVFYNGAYQQINQNLAGNHIVIFQTVSINYQSSGTIEYSFGGGSLMPFTTPMELLPVSYKFRFTESGYPDREFTKIFGTSEVKSLAYVRFLNSMNMPIEGAAVDFDLGGWTAGEATDADGISFNLLEGTLGNVNTRVSHAGSANKLEQDLSLNSYIDFSTVAVTLQLLSSENAELESENAEYFTDSWMQFGDGITTETLELLRDTYTFKVYFAGAFEEKKRIVSTDTVIEYNTVAVTMELLSSEGNEVESSDAIYSPYSSSIWYTFGDGVTTETIELLPQNYGFRFYFGGAMKQKNQNVSLDQLVSHELTLVTVELLDIDGNELTSDNITYFITGNGWNQFSDGVTTATMDLLSSFYDFRVYFNGEVMQMAQQIGNDPVVTFVYEVANDLCENAIPLDCGSSIDGSTIGATFDDVGFCGTSNTTSGVWYTFEALSSTTILSTCNQADYDTKISVFSGSCGSLSCVGGQDDAAGCAGFTTNLTVSTTPGETYYVLVHGFSSATGNFTLSLDCDTPPEYAPPLSQSVFETEEDINSEFESMNNESINDAENIGVIAESTPAIINNGANYPNPFSTSTFIEYEVEYLTDVNLSVYNLEGRVVKVLVNAEVYPGTYRIEFDGTDQNGNYLPSGTYIYKLSGNEFLETNRMIIQR